MSHNINIVGCQIVVKQVFSIELFFSIECPLLLAGIGETGRVERMKTKEDAGVPNGKRGG
jgi:hypothetical protein